MRDRLKVGAIYIEDLRLNHEDYPLDHNMTYRDRFKLRFNGYDIPQIRDMVVDELVRNDSTVMVTGRKTGLMTIYLGWEGRWGMIRMTQEEPVVELIGSFRLNETLCRYADDPSSFQTTDFTLGGVPHTMRSDGYLLRQGEPILRVMSGDPVPVCLRLAGTAHENYSFTHEIPVRALSGNNMHEINYKEFERMIKQMISVPGMGIRPLFSLALGIRRWAKDYARLYKIADMPITDAEKSFLAKGALLEGQEDIEYVLRRYRDLYDLSYGDPLPGLDQDILNDVSASQA